MAHLRFTRLAAGAAAFVTGLLVGATLAGAAGPVERPHVEVELVSENLSLAPGREGWLGLRMKLERGWHVYWINPGDSGLPPELKVSAPPGAVVGSLQFPFPDRMPVPPLMNYGYSDEVLFPFSVTLPQASTEGEARFEAKASWLICADVCIPGKAELDLTVKVRHSEPAPHPDWNALFGKTRQHLPRKASGFDFAAWSGTDRLRLSVSGKSGAVLPGADMDFFPLTEGALEHAAPVAARSAPERRELEFRRPANAPALERLRGVIVFPDAAVAYEFEAPVGKLDPSLPPLELKSGDGASAGDRAGKGRSFALMALFALLGGLLLNFMPCVFPVVSIKVLSLLDSAHSDPAAARRHGLVFSAGVVTSFLALAGALFALRAAGAELGWGFQLQSPAFVAGLGLLFFILGLNLLGLFEIGTRLMGIGGSGLAERKTYLGSLYSGVLATIVSTPCSAPFMGAALGYAITLPAASGLMLFLCLGVGMAAPYLVLTSTPALLKRLPRPGRWMETFKEFMAFPMFATTLWLAWVLGQQGGANLALALIAGCLLSALGLWWMNRAGHTWLSRVIAIVLIAIGAALALGEGRQPRESGAKSAVGAPFGGLPTHAFTPTRVEELRRAGKIVFLDFTAAWCVSCQVNERVVFASEAVVSAFRRHGVEIVKADWTHYDPVITRALAEHGRNGVPLYVLYPAAPAAAPIVLPEILTPGIVLEELDRVVAGRAKP